MEQRNDRKPNPEAKPDQDRPGGTGATRQSQPPQDAANPSTQSPPAPTAGAFGKEGHSNRRHGVDSTGASLAGDERSGLDEDTPTSAVGDPHLTRSRTAE